MEMNGKAYLEKVEIYKELISPLMDGIVNAMGLTIPDKQASEIAHLAWDAFMNILPEIPYIGGENNPLTENLLGAAYEMGFYTLMEQRGYELKKISEIDQNATRASTKKKIEKLGLEFLRNSVMDKEDLLRGSELFKRMGFKDNWAYEVVEPREKDDFAIGINYLKCPIVDLFKKHGKERYLPYICANDYPFFGEMGVSLERTQTLGNGDPVCDFRFKVNDESGTENAKKAETLAELDRRSL
jgi:hypothetical protein